MSQIINYVEHYRRSPKETKQKTLKELWNMIKDNHNYTLNEMLNFNEENEIIKPFFDFDPHRYSNDEKFDIIEFMAKLKIMLEEATGNPIQLYYSYEVRQETHMKYLKDIDGKKEYPFKHSIHAFITNFSMTRDNLIDLVDDLPDVINVPFDSSIYNRKGGPSRKFRMVSCKKELGFETYQVPMSGWKDENDLAHYLVQIVEGLPLYEYKSMNGDHDGNDEESFTPPAPAPQKRGRIGPPFPITEMAQKLLDEHEPLGVGTYLGDCYIVSVKYPKECPFTQRCHRSNHTMFVFNSSTAMCYLKCHDEQCKGKRKVLRRTMYFKIQEDEEDEEKSISIKIGNRDQEKFDVKRISQIANMFPIHDTTPDDQIHESYNHTKLAVEKYFFQIQKPFVFMDKYGDIYSNNDMAGILKPIQCWGKKTKIDKFPFYNDWCSDPSICRYLGFGFYPPPLECPKDFFNTFDEDQYYKIIRSDLDKNVDIELLIQHFKNVICSEDSRIIKFLINYIYHLITQPGDNPQIFITFYSEVVGVGKNTFWFIVFKLMNELYCSEVDGTEYFSGSTQFNPIEYQKILLVINEGCALKKDTIEQLKSKITNEKIPINMKFKNIIMQNNFTRRNLTTNQHKSVNVSGKTRRFFIVKIRFDTTKNEKYFNSIYQMMKDVKIMRAFWEWILTTIDPEDKAAIDNGSYNFQQRIIMTSYAQRMIASNTASFTQFLGFLTKHYENHTTVDIKSNDMRTMYIFFMGQIGNLKFSLTHKNLISFMEEIEIDGSQIFKYVKIRGNRYYRIYISQLKKYLKLVHPHFNNKIDSYIGPVLEAYIEYNQNDQKDRNNQNNPNY